MIAEIFGALILVTIVYILLIFIFGNKIDGILNIFSVILGGVTIAVGAKLVGVSKRT